LIEAVNICLSKI